MLTCNIDITNPLSSDLNLLPGELMFGIEDPQVLLAYGLAIGLAVVCIVYGWLKRNEAD
jgi:hypothetical protein